MAFTFEEDECASLAAESAEGSTAASSGTSGGRETKDPKSGEGHGSRCKVRQEPKARNSGFCATHKRARDDLFKQSKVH